MQLLLKYLILLIAFLRYIKGNNINSNASVCRQLYKSASRSGILSQQIGTDCLRRWQNIMKFNVNTCKLHECLLNQIKNLSTPNRQQSIRLSQIIFQCLNCLSSFKYYCHCFHHVRCKFTLSLLTYLIPFLQKRFFGESKSISKQK